MLSWLILCALGAADAGERVVFRWAPLADAVVYELQIATDPEFRNVLLNPRTQVPGYRWQRETNETVFFRVRGWDVHGNPGEWSEAREVEARPEKPVEPVKPPAPTLRGPRAGTWWRLGRAVRLEWTARESVSRWHVEVAAPGGSTRYEAEKPLYDLVPERAGMHKWRVRELEPEGPWSGWSTFDVRLPPPSLVAPAADSVQPCGPVVLTWKAVPSAREYHVEVAGDNVFENVLHRGRVTELTWTTPALEGGSYWWRVAAREASRRSGLPAVRGFVLVCLEAPKLVGPGPDAVFDARQAVSFDWAVVPSAARYDLEIDGSARPSVSPAGSASDLSLGEHTWRVRAVTAAGFAGPWSEPRSLVVEPRRTVRASWAPQLRAVVGGEAVFDIQLYDGEGEPVRAAPVTVEATSGTIGSVTETDAGYRVAYRAPPTPGDDSIAIREREFVAHAVVGVDAVPRRFQAGARLGWQLSGLGNLTSPVVSIDALYALPGLPVQVSARFSYLRHAASIPAGEGVPEIEQVAHVVPITVAAAFVVPIAGVDVYAGGGLVLQAAALSVGPESRSTLRVGFEALAGGACAVGPGFACAELAMSLSGLDDELLRLPTDTFMLSVGYRLPLF